MSSHFNFYDLVGYIIPGGIVLAFLYCFVIAFVPLMKPITIIGVGFGESLVFLGISYFLGHVIQVLGNCIETQRHSAWGGWFSDQFLQPENTYFSSDFKGKLTTCIKQVFDIDPSPTDITAKGQRKRRSEAFSLCYALIVQKGIAAHAEIFNGIYGLYRGIISAVWIGVVIALLITIKHVILLWLPSIGVMWPPGDFFTPNLSHVWIGLMVLGLLLIAIPLLDKRLKRFSQHFANSVYKNFYVWCCQQGMVRR